MKRTIQKYYLFQFLANMGFFNPVIVLFWQQNGLSMTQIMLLQSFYGIAVSILELPTGAFADYFGKKKSLLVGALFWAGGCFWYGTSNTFWQFFVGEFLIGLGSAFFSGADRAYLHQVLRDEGEEGTFKKAEGRARGFIQVAQGVGSIIGGFIATISLGLTIVTTGLTNLINVGIIMTFPSVKKTKDHSLSYFQIIKESLILTYQHKELLWLTLFFSTFYALVWPMQFYAQVYLTLIKLPLYQFGIAYFAINLIAAFFLSYTHEVEKKAKGYIYLIFTITIVISFIIVAYFQSIYLLPVWALFAIANFMNQTIISSRVLAIVPHHKASTILSFQSLMRRLIYSAILPVLGYVSDTFSFKHTFLLYAGLAFILLSTLLVLKKRFE
jgi:MFS family permease